MSLDGREGATAPLNLPLNLGVIHNFQPLYKCTNGMLGERVKLYLRLKTVDIEELC